MDNFEARFEFADYTAIVKRHSLCFETIKSTTCVPSMFTNRYSDKTGILVIKNVYMRLNSYFPHERKQMFDFIIRGFNLDIYIHEENNS